MLACAPPDEWSRVLGIDIVAAVMGTAAASLRSCGHHGDIMGPGLVRHLARSTAWRPALAEHLARLCADPRGGWLSEQELRNFATVLDIFGAYREEVRVGSYAVWEDSWKGIVVGKSGDFVRLALPHDVLVVPVADVKALSRTAPPLQMYAGVHQRLMRTAVALIGQRSPEAMDLRLVWHETRARCLRCLQWMLRMYPAMCHSCQDLVPGARGAGHEQARTMLSAGRGCRGRILHRGARGRAALPARGLSSSEECVVLPCTII